MNFYEFLLSFFIIVGRPVIIHTHYLWKRVLYLQLRNLFFLLTFSRFHRCVHVFIRKEKSLSDLGALHVFFFCYAKEHGEKNTFLPNNKIRKIYAPLAHKKEFCCFWKREGKKKNLANRLTDWTEASYMVFLKKISNRGFLSSLICLKLRVSALETRVNAWPISRPCYL